MDNKNRLRSSTAACFHSTRMSSIILALSLNPCTYNASLSRDALSLCRSGRISKAPCFLCRRKGCPCSRIPSLRKLPAEEVQRIHGCCFCSPITAKIGPSLKGSPFLVVSKFRVIVQVVSKMQPPTAYRVIVSKS